MIDPQDRNIDPPPVEPIQKTNGQARCDYCNRTKAEGCLCRHTVITEADRQEMARTKQIAARYAAESKEREARLKALQWEEEKESEFTTITCKNCGEQEPQSDN